MKEAKNNPELDFPKFSFVIAIYERANELDELLESMTQQSFSNFEVIVVDDGSKTDLKPVIEKYKSKLSIHYFYKQNEGASLARNFGADFANGKYLLFVDSDCILAKKYLESIENELNKKQIDFFGGPDDASQDFSILQKALSYAMTSFFTTGGIRGGKANKNYQPRSFNMGILKELFLEINGFKNIKIGEDIDLSLRMVENKIKPKLISGAKVFHKRRINLISFAKRVYSFGFMRPTLIQWHPVSNRMVFYLPTLFLLGSFGLIFLSFFYTWFLFPILLWIFLVFIESALKYKNLLVSFLSVFTSFIQIYAYGLGFLWSWIKLNFYKSE